MYQFWWNALPPSSWRWSDTFLWIVDTHLQGCTTSLPSVSRSIYYFMCVSMYIYIFLCINLLHISVDTSMQIHESVSTCITISLSRHSVSADNSNCEPFFYCVFHLLESWTVPSFYNIFDSGGRYIFVLPKVDFIWYFLTLMATLRGFTRRA